MEAKEVAKLLNTDAKALRDWLRKTYPRSDVEFHARWDVEPHMVAAARTHFSNLRGRGLR